MQQRAELVNCTGCPWKGGRAYITADSMAGNQRRQGFGACPKCGGPVVRRVNKLRAMRDARAAADFAELEPERS